MQPPSSTVDSRIWFDYLIPRIRFQRFQLSTILSKGVGRYVLGHTTPFNLVISHLRHLNRLQSQWLVRLSFRNILPSLGWRELIEMILSAEARPYAFKFDPAKTALLLSQFTSMLAIQWINVIFIAILVDYQRDFIEDGGFGEIQGGNLAAVQASVGPAAAVLKLARKAGIMIVHTREGHEPGLRDCPTCKVRS